MLADGRSLPIGDVAVLRCGLPIVLNRLAPHGFGRTPPHLFGQIEIPLEYLGGQQAGTALHLAMW